MSEIYSAYEAPFQVIKDFLDEQKYPYSTDEEEHRCTLTFPLGEDQYEMAYWLSHHGELLQFSILFPNGPIAEKDRLGVAEIIVRANHSMEFGRLDMNMRTGEVRYYATHIIDEGYLGDGVLSRLSFLGIFLVDMYTSAIKKHLEEGFSPEDVIALVDLDLDMTADGHFLEEEE
jgi:hypothetical protein